MFIKRKDPFSSAYNGGRLHVSGEEVALGLPRPLSIIWIFFPPEVSDGGEVLLSLEVVPLPPVIREIDRMFSFSREETDHCL